ncbi:uncharacterized protein LOC144215265 isoform X2 [Stigmatopora nigra]
MGATGGGRNHLRADAGDDSEAARRASRGLGRPDPLPRIPSGRVVRSATPDKNPSFSFSPPLLSVQGCSWRSSTHPRQREPGGASGVTPSAAPTPNRRGPRCPPRPDQISTSSRLAQARRGPAPPKCTPAHPVQQLASYRSHQAVI